MEMVTAMQMVVDAVNVNAWLIMSMPRIAPIMDVSTNSKPLCFFLLLDECNNTYQLAEPS